MQSYFVSYIKEDTEGLGFGYRIFNQEKKINIDSINDLAIFLKEFEKTDRIIIINLINITNSI